MISLDEKTANDIKLEAEKAYPNECCGFIFGHMNNNDKSVEFIYPCENTSDVGEQYHRFTITPELMLKAELTAQKLGIGIIGFYHSHPDCEAVPSEYDRTHALPIYNYIIVSVKNGKSDAFNSWELDEKTDYKQFSKVTVNIGKGDV